METYYFAAFTTVVWVTLEIGSNGRSGSYGDCRCRGGILGCGDLGKNTSVESLRESALDLQLV